MHKVVYEEWSLHQPPNQIWMTIEVSKSASTNQTQIQVGLEVPHSSQAIRIIETLCSSIASLIQIPIGIEV